MATARPLDEAHADGDQLHTQHHNDLAHYANRAVVVDEGEGLTASAARSTLGLGTAAVTNTGTGATNTILGNDTRLTDSRTPTAHASTHQPGGSDQLAVDAAAGVGSLRTLGTSGTSAAAGNDARLSDSRTPTAHAASHASAGSDAVTPGAIGAVPTTRTVTAGTGLSGGGDLSANRTLAVAYGASSGTTAQGNDSRLFTRPATFVGLGDSITVDGGRIQNADPGPTAYATKYSWQWWGQVLSDSRLLWAANFGLGAQTVTQIKNTYLPYVLAASPRPDYCVLLAGQNDLGGVTGATLTDYTSIVTQLMNAGITPILCTLPPSATAIGIHILNSHIRRLSESLRTPVCDLHAAVMDTGTGLWTAAYTRDGVHASEVGAAVMGATLAAVINSIVPLNSGVAWLPKTNTGYSAARSGTGGNVNPLLLTDDGGTPPVPNVWEIMSGSHSTAVAFSTPGGAVAGRRATFTAGSSQLIVRNYLCYEGGFTGGAQVGDKILVMFRLGATVAGVGGSWGWGIIGNSGTPLYDFGRIGASYSLSDLSPSVFHTVVTVDEVGFVYADFVVNTTGAALSISEFVALNLTGMGVS